MPASPASNLQSTALASPKWIEIVEGKRNEVTVERTKGPRKHSGGRVVGEKIFGAYPIFQFTSGDRTVTMLRYSAMVQMSWESPGLKVFTAEETYRGSLGDYLVSLAMDLDAIGESEFKACVYALHWDLHPNYSPPSWREARGLGGIDTVERQISQGLGG